MVGPQTEKARWSILGLYALNDGSSRCCRAQATSTSHRRWTWWGPELI